MNEMHSKQVGADYTAFNQTLIQQKIKMNPSPLKIYRPTFIVQAMLILGLAAAGCASAPKARDGKDRQCGTFCAKLDACLGTKYSDEAKYQLCELARCESGCRPGATSPAGYVGPFQYAAKTWKSICGPVFDRDGLERCKPSSSMTDVCCSATCAADMIAQGGIRNWPTCGR
jgi:hypothetical protein